MRRGQSIPLRIEQKARKQRRGPVTIASSLVPAIAVQSRLNRIPHAAVMSRLRGGETQPAALSAAILRSVSVGHFREPEVWGDGSARFGRSGRKTKQLALFGPAERQIAQFLQPGCGQVDGLLAEQYFLDNIRRQQSKLNRPAELGRVGGLPPCQFASGGRFASSQCSEPPVCIAINLTSGMLILALPTSASFRTRRADRPRRLSVSGMSRVRAGRFLGIHQRPVRGPACSRNQARRQALVDAKSGRCDRYG